MSIQADLSRAERRLPGLPDRYNLLLLAAVVPAVLVRAGTDRFLLAPAGALIAALLVAVLSALLSNRRPGWSWLGSSLLFALLLPDAVSPWQAMAAMAFGLAAGERIFGTEGHAPVHPAALALVALSLCGALPPGGGPDWTASAATLPGLCLLLASGMLPWRTAAALALAVALFWSVSGTEVPPALLPAILLICHPHGGAVTLAGRVGQGLLAGVLLSAAAGTVAGAACAAFVASLFSPLIDRAVLGIHQMKRGGRLG